MSRLAARWLWAALAAVILLPWMHEAHADDEPELPIRRVVLFTSGVAYFDHAGEVEGDETIELKFNVRDVNDLLKSMVLQDFGGGKVSTVTYESQDPIARTLQTFAIDLTRAPTVADLLRQIRGRKVEVDTPKPIAGQVVGVEMRKIPVGEQVLDSETLILKTESGLRAIPLQQIAELRLLDERLSDDFQKALALLAGAHDAQRKTVTLDFRGDGRRPVRVGYVQEFPIWKTSYRLVLSDDKPPFLQGWAIVENVTEHDWREVGLTLVSGRPISFVMDLYQPLYQTRPLVVPERHAGLHSRVHSQDLGVADSESVIVGTFGGKPVRRNVPVVKPFAASGGFGGGGGGFGGGGGMMGGGGLGGAMEDPFGAPPAEPAPQPIDPSQGVAAVAAGEMAGELFRYAIDSPVTLARQRSAMLPIVNEAVEGEKVAVYNRQTHAKHPLDAFRLKNVSKLHLMQGPITVFDANQYAGDARIGDIPPGAERLISYALDLETEITVSDETAPSKLVAVRVEEGVIKVRERQIRRHTYLVKNSADAERSILIEQPIAADWKLIAPEKPAERTSDLYRFAASVEGNKTTKFLVEEERITHTEHLIELTDAAKLTLYLTAEAASDEVRKLYKDLQERRQELSAANRVRQEIERQLAEIAQEQGRIRQNMAPLDRQTELYREYVKKLTEQELRIESLRDQAQDARDHETKLETSLKQFIAAAKAE